MNDLTNIIEQLEKQLEYAQHVNEEMEAEVQLLREHNERLRQVYTQEQNRTELALDR